MVSIVVMQQNAGECFFDSLAGKAVFCTNSDYVVIASIVKKKIIWTYILFSSPFLKVKNRYRISLFTF